MQLNRILPLATILASACLTACGGGPKVKATYGAAPRYFEGFPSNSWNSADEETFVNVEVSFVSSHKKLFGTDLSLKGILPVRLILGLRGEQMSTAQIRLDSDQSNMRLYLPDGSVLVPVSVEDAAEAAGNSNRDKVIERSVEAGIILDYERAKEAQQFVYFSLKGLDKPLLNGSRLSFNKGNERRVVNLSKALVAFNVMVKDSPQAFFAGISNL